ncbi:MAG: hypothetical protein OEW58_05770 [Gammaproteobacteria bacterium]|nr:hypothetical protein [Gammaproteobacteria bacterium]
MTGYSAAHAAEINNTTSVTDEQLLKIMEDARQAMTAHQYMMAIKLYRQLAEMPDHVLRQDAIESLGLAYERAGKQADAKRAYEYFLQLYPDSAASERIRQRLAGIVTATWKDKEKLDKPKEKAGSSTWNNYGSWSQYFRRNGSLDEDNKDIVNLNLLSSNLDLNGRGKIGNLDLKTRFTGSENTNIDDSSNNYQTLNYLYAEINSRGSGFYSRIGRQRPKSGGIMGRFDGVHLGYHINNSLIFNVTAGYPVDRSKNIFIDDSREFYGVTLETGPWHEYWLANIYAIRQMSESYLDREATGGELRYIHPKHNLYTFVDYDTHFETLNIFSTQASVTASESIIFNAFLDVRHTPTVTTRNALFGQQVTTLTELHKSNSPEAIQQMALNNSPKYYLSMASMTYKFNSMYQLDTDITASKLETSPSMPAMSGSSNPMEYYFSTRLTISEWFGKRDVNIVGLRYADTANSTQQQLLLNSRFYASEKWSLNPSIIVDNRRYSGNSQQSELRVVPGFRTEYLASRSFSMDMEIVPEWSERKDTVGNYEYKNYYVNMGYRYIFD